MIPEQAQGNAKRPRVDAGGQRNASDALDALDVSSLSGALAFLEQEAVVLKANTLAIRCALVSHGIANNPHHAQYLLQLFRGRAFRRCSDLLWRTLDQATLMKFTQTG